MNASALMSVVAAIAFALTAACDGANPERNIIVDRPPFYHEVLAYSPGSEGEIVAAVKAFAKEHGMDYLGGPDHPTLDEGQFNLHAAGPNLNLGVVRVATSLPNTEVFAIARGVSSTSDRALIAEFVSRLKGIQPIRRPR
jgi:hypothetical protein